jgi:hypothetical protein
MSDYDNEMATDEASRKLKADLEVAQPSATNRLKVNVSHLVYRCTFGKVGTPKPSSGKGACPGLK